MRKNWAWGLAAIAAIVAIAYYYDKRQKAAAALKAAGGAGGGTGGGALPAAGQSGYDVGKWHVAAVNSDYGRTVFTTPATVTDFNPGDYVLFALAYGGANDATKDPAAMAVGQIGALSPPTAAGKKTASIRFIQAVKPNSNWSPAVPPPPTGTFYSVTTDDVSQVLTPAETQQYLGT